MKATDLHQRIDELEAECERLREELAKEKAEAESLRYTLDYAGQVSDAERHRAEEAEGLVAQLADALDDMWWQFAYRGAKGKLLTGGLSALEHCEEMLEHPAVKRVLPKASLPEDAC